jgi:hypothetical protein
MREGVPLRKDFETEVGLLPRGAYFSPEAGRGVSATPGQRPEVCEAPREAAVARDTTLAGSLPTASGPTRNLIDHAPMPAGKRTGRGRSSDEQTQPPLASSTCSGKGKGLDPSNQVAACVGLLLKSKRTVPRPGAGRGVIATPGQRPEVCEAPREAAVARDTTLDNALPTASRPTRNLKDQSPMPVGKWTGRRRSSDELAQLPSTCSGKGEGSADSLVTLWSKYQSELNLRLSFEDPCDSIVKSAADFIQQIDQCTDMHTVAMHLRKATSALVAQRCGIQRMAQDQEIQAQGAPVGSGSSASEAPRIRVRK